MNLFDGVFDKVPGSFRAAWGDSIQVAQPGVKSRSDHAILGIRPKHAGFDVAGNGLTGMVAMVEPTGGDVHNTLLKVAMPERLDFADGPDISLTAASQRAHDSVRQPGRG